MARDEHRADRDAVTDNGLHQLRRGWSRIAVAENDDVLEAGARFLQGLVRFLHRSLKRGHIALVHSRDGAAHCLLVADFCQLKYPVLGAVPKQHAHLVLRAEGLQHADGAIAGGLVAVHELHAVHDEHHRAGRQDLFAAQFHVHGQRLLQRRAPITAGRICLIAANADQPEAEVAHRAFEQFHQRVAQVAGRDVAQKNAVVTLHLGERAGKFGDVGHFHLEVRRAQRGEQWRVFVRFGGDQQDARITADGGEVDGAVVLRHRIARRFDLHLVIVKTRFGQSLGKSEKVLAVFQLDWLFAQQTVVLKQPHRRALGLIGLREDFDFKRLSFLEVARQRQLLHRDIAAARDAERNDVNAHTQRSGREHCGKCVAYVLVAIGQQH